MKMEITLSAAKKAAGRRDMRYIIIAFAIASELASAARAADKPIIGPKPSWVIPVSRPTEPDRPDEAPIQLLIADQQVALERGRITVFNETELKIQTPRGLAAGNISFAWRPDTDELTVHKLLIRRGDQVIDVLASGQTFTVVRREQNLESAMLDGVLTANIQPEGLQVGDILEFSASISSSDPTLKGHVEQIGATWNGIPIGRAHLRVQWPVNLPVKFRQTAALPPLKTTKTGDLSVVELSLDKVVPIVPPSGAPMRYAIGRMIEMTDFGSWSDLGALMAPLYEKAAILPSQGPLRDELERIRNLSPDSNVRAEAALALVQDRIRYVALAMGVGGLVPADAETTWSRRYGDCKAKTALLLTLLHALDIHADPVAVSTVFGDGMDARLPMIGLFNHVLVRATINGKTYWLDGTRTGDTSLDRLTVPAFGWGLPLIASGATLVRLMPAPLDVPTQEVSITIDATAGLSIPAPAKVDMILRGDDAIGTKTWLSNLTGQVRESALRDYWREQYDFIEVKSTSATFDPKTGEQRLQMEGLAKMDWKDGWYETDGTGVGYKADFARAPAQDQNAPYAVAYPSYVRNTETILLPPGFPSAKATLKSDVDQTIAGTQYYRRATIDGKKFTIETTSRAIAPEFPAKEAVAAQAALRDLADRTVYLRKPTGYRLTDQEVKQALAETPTTADAFIARGSMLLDRYDIEKAIRDFDQAYALDPKNVTALTGRGMARVWKGDFEGASKDFDNAQALDARNAMAFRGRGLLAQMKGESKNAITAYTQELDIAPNNPFALGHRAQANREIGDLPAALRDASAALKLQPEWIELYLLRADILRLQGDKESAMKEAAAVEAANPDNTYAYVMSAQIYDLLSEAEEGMKAYERALAIKPSAFIYVNRSLFRSKSDVPGRAADLDAALKLDPAYLDAWAEKADVQSDAGDFRGAIATYSTALEKAPDRMDLLAGRGIAYSRAGDKQQADKDFANVRAKAEAPGALNNLCWAKATAGVALESALIDCNAALKEAPDVAGYLDSRALVYLRLGRLEEAIADYDRALAKHYEAPMSLYGRAIAWARKGDKSKSEADAAAALKISPKTARIFEGYGLKL